MSDADSDPAAVQEFEAPEPEAKSANLDVGIASLD